ncbi:MAG TPA: low molecular weight protein arginine phosphatase [Symbiobacteriaceae bacterium]|nr:low molecular weight protein arginine phosphatase [Symbiobacteriaceae bacterium]
MRVLLVCSGNTCRSPMAGALLQGLWRGDEQLEVLTAGTSTVHGLPATTHAVTAMQERGLDLGAHRSQPVTPALLKSVDLVLTMTVSHREALRAQFPAMANKIHTLAEYAGSARDVSDPFGGPLDEYRRTAQSLAELLSAAISRMQRKES